MEWQPIETAPKDGTWLLLCLENWDSVWDVDGDYHPRFTLGRWDGDTYQQPCWLSDKTCHEFWDYGGCTGAGVSITSVEVAPTHWMHLPEPPKGIDIPA